MQEWRARNPNYNKEYGRKRYKNYGDRYKAYARKGRLKSLYGISLEDYEAMVIKQDGKCAICGEPPKRYRMAVDHDHASGAIRSLLCIPCNTKLHALENTSWRGAAEAYLMRHAGDSRG